MDLIIAISLFFVSLYLLNKYLHNYWSRRGFKQLEPSFFLGDGKNLLTLKEPIGDFFASLYEKNKKHRILGLYMTYTPVTLVNDPVLLQHIMIKDFSSFHDRPMPVDEVYDPLSGHLFSIGGQKWRDLRVKLSPTFTSGKLKGMFPIIKDCGGVLENYLVKNVKQGVDVFEFRDLLARFSTNIISSVAFGIDNDCINDPEHIFRRMGSKIFEPSFKNGIRGMVQLLIPKLFYKIKLKSVDQEIEDFIFTIIKQNVEYREKKNFTRNDFMQLLMQLKSQGYVSADKEDKTEDIKKGSEEEKRKLSLSEIAAQAFVFFIAGFETTSSTMSFCLFELCKNPEVQQKVQDEIDKVLKKAGPEGLTYDLLEQMTYLDSCVSETLRKYPVVPILMREALKDYKIPETDLTLPKGTSVFIPLMGLHRDPKIFENPLQFKPERFLNSPNGNGNSKGIFYLPFGDGPRNCIGMRMGKVTTKLGLAMVLSKFNLELTDKDMMTKELKFHPNQGILSPIKLFNLKVKTRK